MNTYDRNGNYRDTRFVALPEQLEEGFIQVLDKETGVAYKVDANDIISKRGDLTLTPLPAPEIDENEELFLQVGKIRVSRFRSSSNFCGIAVVSGHSKIREFVVRDSFRGDNRTLEIYAKVKDGCDKRLQRVDIIAEQVWDMKKSARVFVRNTLEDFLDTYDINRNEMGHNLANVLNGYPNGFSQ